MTKAVAMLCGAWRAPRGAAACEDGNAIVEMAIGISLFLMILIGIIEMGLALYTYNYISDAAREGSRWAIVRGSDCSTNTPGLDHCNAAQTDIQTYVQSLSYPGINSSNMTVTATWLQASSPPAATWSSCVATASEPCNQQGYQVRVTVTYPFPLSIPFWRSTTLTVGSTSGMVISQ
ncbi:MAG: TadE/TadG family type IV pilus assembly protein [Terracidiphilus sp.]